MVMLAEQPESRTICLLLDAVTAPKKSSSMNEGKAKITSLLCEQACSASRKARGKTVGEATKLELINKTELRLPESEEHVHSTGRQTRAVAGELAKERAEDR